MRLTKTQIKTAPTKVLNSRYCHLLEKGERIPAHEFSMAEAREILWIEDELHERLIVAVGHDFYPPEGVSKPTMADLRGLLNPFKKSKPAPRSIIKADPQPAPKAVESAEKTEGSLSFKIVITSSIGSTVATQKVKADSKESAGVMALKMIEQLGLKKAKYKVS